MDRQDTENVYVKILHKEREKMSCRDNLLRTLCSIILSNYLGFVKYQDRISERTYTVQKISYKILDRIGRLTNAELNILLYMAKYQDDRGNIRGVYFRDVCTNLHICNQTFYNGLEALQEKNIISYRKASYWDYDVTILDNDFGHAEALKEGYVSLAHSCFDVSSLQRMGRIEKVMLLHLMKMTYSVKGCYHIQKERFYRKYAGIAGVRQKALMHAMHKVRQYFDISLRGKEYIIRAKHKVRQKSNRNRSEAEQLREHLLDTILRRHKMKSAGMEKRQDMLTLFRQYEERIHRLGKDVYTVISNAVAASMRQPDVRQLEPALVHTYIMRSL